MLLVIIDALIPGESNEKSDKILTMSMVMMVLMFILLLICNNTNNVVTREADYWHLVTSIEEDHVITEDELEQIKFYNNRLTICNNKFFKIKVEELDDYIIDYDYYYNWYLLTHN